MKILFLYTELAGYVVSCLNKAAEDESITEIHVVRYPVNPEAPFLFEFHPKVKIHERYNYSNNGLLELTQKINPNVIVCSGWIDKAYLSICKHFKGIINTVLTLDNHWNGSFKQRVLAFISPFVLKNKFSHCWVPGEPQKRYALKLGFSLKRIKTGFYSIEVSEFSQNLKPKKDMPKRFLCVARYIPAKGWNYLWEGFKLLQERHNTDWELWCAGTGEGFDDRVEYPGIKHIGFVQPEDLKLTMENSSVFVLPSLFEPWGVVVQEFAAAGFPMLLSKEVGSIDMFLREGENGYSFAPGNSEEIYKSLLKIVNHTPEDLILMGEASKKLSLVCDIEHWVSTLKWFVTDGSV